MTFLDASALLAAMAFLIARSRPSSGTGFGEEPMILKAVQRRQPGCSGSRLEGYFGDGTLAFPDPGCSTPDPPALFK